MQSSVNRISLKNALEEIVEMQKGASSQYTQIEELISNDAVLQLISSDEELKSRLINACQAEIKNLGASSSRYGVQLKSDQEKIIRLQEFIKKIQAADALLNQHAEVDSPYRRANIKPNGKDTLHPDANTATAETRRPPPLRRELTLAGMGQLFTDKETISFRVPHSEETVILSGAELDADRLGRGNFGKAYRIDYFGTNPSMLTFTQPMFFVDKSGQKIQHNLAAFKVLQQQDSEELVQAFASEQAMVDAISDEYFKRPENQRPHGINIGRSAVVTSTSVDSEGRETKTEIPVIFSKYEGAVVDNQFFSVNGEDFFHKLFHPESRRSKKDRDLFAKFDEQKELIVMQFLKTLHDAIGELHDLGFIHRDLALRNVFIEIVQNEDRTIGIKAVIGDFGFARALNGNTQVQTPTDILPWRWSDLESLNGLSSKKTDLFSFKIVMHEIMSEALDVKLDNLVSQPLSEEAFRTSGKLPDDADLELADKIKAIGSVEIPLQWYKLNLQRADSLSKHTEGKQIAASFLSHFGDYLTQWSDIHQDQASFNEIYEKYFIQELHNVMDRYPNPSPNELRKAYLELQSLLLVQPENNNYSHQQKEFISQCVAFTSQSLQSLDHNSQSALDQFNKLQQTRARHPSMIIRSEITEAQLQDTNKRLEAILAYYNKFEDIANKYAKNKISPRLIELSHMENLPSDVIQQLKDELRKLESYADIKNNEEGQILIELIEGQIRVIENNQRGKNSIWQEFSKKYNHEKEKILPEMLDQLDKQLKLYEDILKLANDENPQFNRVHLATAFALMKSIPKLYNQIENLKSIDPKFVMPKDIQQRMQILNRREVFKQYDKVESYQTVWEAIRSQSKPNLRPENNPNVLLAKEMIKIINTLQKSHSDILRKTNLEQLFKSAYVRQHYPEISKSLGNKNIKDVLAFAVLADPSLSTSIASIAGLETRKTVLDVVTNSLGSRASQPSRALLPSQIRQARTDNTDFFKKGPTKHVNETGPTVPPSPKKS